MGEESVHGNPPFPMELLAMDDFWGRSGYCVQLCIHYSTDQDLMNSVKAMIVCVWVKLRGPAEQKTIMNVRKGFVESRDSCQWCNICKTEYRNSNQNALYNTYHWTNSFNKKLGICSLCWPFLGCAIVFISFLILCSVSLPFFLSFVFLLFWNIII